ncbi:sterol esterase [Xylariaceae sp. FL0594]|nr:sterol esterase [Xylariaceae sp. FL0594]
MGQLSEDFAVETASHPSDNNFATTAAEFLSQAEKLSLERPLNPEDPKSVAAEAKFVTPKDAIIVTADGNHLPTVPLHEAYKLNILKEKLEHEVAESGDDHANGSAGHAFQSTNRQQKPISGVLSKLERREHAEASKKHPGRSNISMPQSHFSTHPLFPSLPLYGPPSILRDLQCWVFRITSFFLSAAFLAVIVLGATFTNIPTVCQRIWWRLTFRNPDVSRPFYEEEIRRSRKRAEQEMEWERRRSLSKGHDGQGSAIGGGDDEGFIPTEGGPDPVVCDVAYYARRVGLDMEEFQVQTEDGFIIDLWHIYDPREYTRLDEEERSDRGPTVFESQSRQSKKRLKDPSKPRKFPVLLMHGLLQSAGAYCANDDDSLAFFLCKSGYDVWLGNNRCGFHPKHASLSYSDPRMWCWNIRQMGVLDLSALVSRVLTETGFEKIGLICHSQGTTQTFVALAKEQRPELGEKLTAFCALAPAAYAGPLIGKMYFKFMRVISPSMFRLVFGVHAFIPIMMTMHSLLDPHLYGSLGYTVFSFLFDWTDTRWDRGLRDRMFQFAPVYVSAESMRWWLGRECFAKHKCILSTKEEWRSEEMEDRESESDSHPATPDTPAHPREGAREGPTSPSTQPDRPRRKPRGATAWYSEQAPPFALWVAGNDHLVNGERLLRRFERGREPHVHVVHSKVIPEYEHLDVIWAMDAVEKVFKEVREVLWKTCDVRDQCRVPTGCESVPAWVHPEKAASREESEQSSSSDSS